MVQVLIAVVAEMVTHTVQMSIDVDGHGSERTRTELGVFIVAVQSTFDSRRDEQHRKQQYQSNAPPTPETVHCEPPTVEREAWS